MRIATFEIEKELLGQGYSLVLGVDEAGRGPLAGPVVACATTVRNFQFPICQLADNFQTNSKNQILNDRNEIPDMKMWSLIRDSKTLSEKQREKAYDFIMENFYVGIGLCNHETIDRINILEASFLAMKKAIQSLLKASNDQFSMINFQTSLNPPRIDEQSSSRVEAGDQNLNDQKIQNKRTIILVDGNKEIPNFSHEQRAIVGGDGLSKSIAAASIVAKVTRDRMMMEAHEKYPTYGFDKHKGYGTKLHMDTLVQYGPSEIHRKSFAPVTRLLCNT